MKIGVPVLTALALSVIVVFSAVSYSWMTSDDGDGTVERYAIIGAMPEEVEYLIGEMDEEYSQTVGGSVYHVGTLNGKNVVIVKCGEGKVNAAMCAQACIVQFGATAVINTGVAGTLNDNVGIGDIVVSTETVQHDYELTELGYDEGYIPNVGRVAIEADETLREAAVEAISEVDLNINVFQGRVCSGDQFISGFEERNRIVTEFGGLCCEMEGGAIGQVCYLCDIPFVVVRCISDDTNGEGAEDYMAFEKEMAEICASMTLRMLGEL